MLSSKVEYEGYVYCVTVPNHIIFVRRNGKASFSGNSEFMPFAPSMMKEYADEYFENFQKGEYPAEFMTITFNCKKEAQKAAAVVHVDNTARPQVVTKEINPRYYGILNNYYKITGLPTFINTSFNIHEEPIVCTPRDALISLKEDCVDVVTIGNYVVYRKNK